ncbi:MAG: ABC transporter permease [Actinobacteria bacterium]|nr:ABC transporter permease [Actinomycetota bacterium]
MTVAAETLGAPRARRGLLSRLVGFARDHVLTLFAIVALVYLLLPIAIVVVFSFNDPVGRYNFVWQGFTLEHWANPFGYPDLGSAVRLSIEIAALASLFATALGTLIALALVRYSFRGRSTTNLLIFLPMATPEIVMGSSLLTLFLNQGVALGFATILVAHIMFNISYVVVTVRARLTGFDRSLEEAAMDLFATPLATFVRVTLPLIAPAILAAALLAFALSIDDFVITYLVAGNDNTFPLFVWGAARVAVPPQVNVIGTLIFAVAIGLMLGNVLLQLRRARADFAPAA